MPLDNRHRPLNSLQGITDPTQKLLEAHEQARAEQALTKLLDGIDAYHNYNLRYSPVKLLQLAYEYNPTHLGKINFLHYVLGQYNDVPDASLSTTLDRLESISWQLPPKWTIEVTAELAELLIRHFFFPIKGQATSTPQPTPSLTPVGGGTGTHTPTTGRISSLRSKCLIRDSHRCMFTRLFDAATARKRVPMVDDSEELLGVNDLIDTEIAHIIPHALGVAREKEELDSGKTTFWSIMKLFNPRAECILDGVDIDQPLNAMTMNPALHKAFGRLECYLEPDPECSEPHSYILQDSPNVTPVLNPFFRPRDERGRVKFTGGGTDTIDFPDPELIALHRACAIILGMSGAGEYIDRLLPGDGEGIGSELRALERGDVDLGGLVSCKLSDGKAYSPFTKCLRT